MEITTTATTLPGFSSDPAATAPGGALGKDQFLQLLMAQMRNQDPLDPMNSQETVAQLAQFSSLEQMSNLNAQFEQFRQENGLFGFMQLGGKMLSAELKDGTSVEGMVDRVTWDKTAGVQVTINGTAIPVSTITGLVFGETTVVDGDTALVPAGGDTDTGLVPVGGDTGM